jgi:hypothetical protein
MISAADRTSHSKFMNENLLEMSPIPSRDFSRRPESTSSSNRRLRREDTPERLRLLEDDLEDDAQVASYDFSEMDLLAPPKSTSYWTR